MSQKASLGAITGAAVLICIGSASCKDKFAHGDDVGPCFPLPADLANSRHALRTRLPDQEAVLALEISPGLRFTVLEQETVLNATSTRYAGVWLDGIGDWGEATIAFDFSGDLTLAENQVGNTLFFRYTMDFSDCIGESREALRYGDSTVRDADGRLLLMRNVAPVSPTGEILLYPDVFPEGTFRSVDVGCPPHPTWPDVTQTALQLTDTAGGRTWTAKRGEVVEVELNGESYLLAPLVVRRRTEDNFCAGASFVLARKGFIVGGDLPE